MSEQEHLFLKNLRQMLIRAGATLMTVIIVGSITFYVVTQVKLNDHDRRILGIEEGAVSKAEYSGDIRLQNEVNKNIVSSLEEIKVDIKDIQSKL